tara:strand:+ start:166 stop:678 length:513 start_codon:yes stop_codon:yes gene_type:complete
MTKSPIYKKKYSKKKYSKKRNRKKYKKKYRKIKRKTMMRGGARVELNPPVRDITPPRMLPLRRPQVEGEREASALVAEVARNAQQNQECSNIEKNLLNQCIDKLKEIASDSTDPGLLSESEGVPPSAPITSIPFAPTPNLPVQTGVIKPVAQFKTPVPAPVPEPAPEPVP